MRYSDLVVKDELMRELEMMSLLDHHNIAQVIDGYEDKKRLAIVMEMYLFVGHSLQLKNILINELQKLEEVLKSFLRKIKFSVNLY